jgi:integrase
VPDDTIFGRLPERQAPHIYSDEEVQQLLAAAHRLGPKPGLRGLVYETLFGLIASTGLRLSEALSLSIGDVDLRRGLLTIRRTKFAKSRQVPLHLSTMQALSQYRWMRDLAGAGRDDEAPFLLGTRGRRFGRPMGGRQVIACSPRYSAVGSASGAYSDVGIGTPLSCGASCYGSSKASTSTRRCCRCRPMSGTPW